MIVKMVNVLMGVVFLIIGIYLPKCKRNYTFGIRVRWTLENEDNWNATHRFGGKVWVIGSILLLASVLLPESAAPVAMTGAILVLSVLPVGYSWLYHRKQVQEGTAFVNPPEVSKNDQRNFKVMGILGVILILFVGALMFTGDITVQYQEETFTVEADFSKDLTMAYEEITSLEYRDTDHRGSRVAGVASSRLLTGTFRNEEFGSYTRCSYTQCDACVVVKTEKKVYVINGPDAEQTKMIYEKLREKME